MRFGISKLTNPNHSLAAGLLLWLVTTAFPCAAFAQAVSTTTVQGTVYDAQGHAASGTVQLTWPAFTTNAGQAIAAGRLSATIGSDGFLSVNLAPNAGSQPAGLYYTAVYHLSNGSTSTEYWTVPAAPSATIAQIRAQVMPAAEAVQAASKSYVDTLVQSLANGNLISNGGALTGPLYLNGDPTAPTQAADKHYVDAQFAQALPLSGGTATGPITATQLGVVYQVDQFPGSDFGAKLQACVNQLNAATGGICDARNFPATVSIASNLTLSTPNASIYLPCATITTATQVQITAGTRNVAIHGCAFQGGSTASGTAGGTVWVYTGSSNAFQIGDMTGAVNTPGFWMHDLNLNTASAGTSATGISFERAQELRLDNLYLNGNNGTGQTAIRLDGTGNYAGGTFVDVYLNGFGTGWLLTGDTAGNYANASTFLKTHVVCPTSSGSPITGTTGINLLKGDGNTFSGGDVEGCATMFHLGPAAINNTIVGLRNENSTLQYQADSGSSFNSVLTGGTLYTGQLVDNGSRNSFSDAFHRASNGMKGDWYASQQDATVTNHQRLGTGQGNERGLLNEVQTDYGNRWEEGYSDAMGTGYQIWQLQDMVNNVNRLAVGQYLSATPNTVTAISLNNGGCYSNSTPPSITITGGSGSGAAATANMTTTANPNCNGGSGYQVGSVTITSGGTGYTTAPTVTFAGSNQITAPSPIAEIVTAGSTNNQTVLNAAGTGAVVINGSTNAGTGGLVLSSGGASPTTAATISGTGNAQFTGSLQVGGASLSAGTLSVRNNADAEVDYYLQPGATTSQKGSFVYKDFNGASQWYMVKDQYNNWALNSAIGTLDSFKAYQSTNSGDTYVNASNSTGHIRLNYESGSGAETDIYSSGALVAVFGSPTAIKFPGLAAASGTYNCPEIDSSGNFSSAPCGGTASIAGLASDGSNGITVSGAVTAGATPGLALPAGTIAATRFYSPTGEFDPVVFGAQALATGTTCTTGNDSTTALQTALSTAQQLRGGIVRLHPGTYCISSPLTVPDGVLLRGSGAFYTYGGTILQNTGSGAAFSITGSGDSTHVGNGRSFELSDLVIRGNNTTDDCIDLLGGTIFPQAYKITGVTCTNFGGRGIYMNGTSYGIIDRVTISSSSQQPCLDIENGGFLTEVSYFEHINTQGCGTVTAGTATATAFAYSGGTLTLTASNNLTAGQRVVIKAGSGDALAALNGRTYTVLASGLSASQFAITEAQVTTASGSTAASAKAVGSAVTIVGGNNLYFHELDQNDGDVGVYITGNSFQNAFLNSNLVRCHFACVELDGTTNATGRNTFENTSMSVSSASDPTTSHYVFAHGGSGGNRVFATDFNVAQAVNNTSPATPLTAGILSADSSLVTFENVWFGNTSDGVSIATPAAFSELGLVSSTSGYQVNGVTVLPPAATGYTGSGKVVLNANPAFANSADSANTVAIQAGAASDQVAGLTLKGYSGTQYWSLQKTAGNHFAAQETSTGLTRLGLNLNGASLLNSGAGANAVSFNMTTGSGTGGVLFGSGGASPAQVASVSNAGAVSASSFSGAGTGLTGTAAALTAGAAVNANVPAWMQYLGDGAGGAYNCTASSCNGSGVVFFTDFTVAAGATYTVSSSDGIVVLATGTCTIAGTINAGGSFAGTFPSIGGGGSGGGGGGTSAGGAGGSSYPSSSSTTKTMSSGGALGAAGGGNGGNASAASSLNYRITLVSGGGTNGWEFGGRAGGAGGSSGGAGGAGGGGVTFICGAMNFTGTILANGANGSDSPGNNQGAGGGGGGGVVIMRSPNWTANTGTISVAGGTGGSCGSYTGCGTGGNGAPGFSAQIMR